MHLSVMLLLAALQTTHALSARASTRDTNSTTSPSILYVASQSLGILTIELDPSKHASESLQIIDTVQGGYHPGWVSAHGDLICSVSRTKYPDNSSTSGGVFTWRAGPQDPSAPDSAPGLQAINNASSEGLGAVYCGISPDGRTLAAADIDGAAVSIHPLSPSGFVGPATHIFQYTLHLDPPGPGWNDSQIKSNPHEAAFDPSGRYVMVPDRGADRLYVYDVGCPAGDVPLVRNISLPAGTGPRHLTFRAVDEENAFMYLVCELDNTVRVFALVYTVGDGGDVDLAEMSLVQVVSTLGLGSNRTAPYNRDMASEVAVSADGRFLYASNRNTVSLKSDTLAVFAVNYDASAQHLTYLGANKTEGKIPRHFSLSPQDEDDEDAPAYVAVANEVSNNLIVFARDTGAGFLEGVVGNLSLGEFDLSQTNGPMAVIWV